MTTTEVKAFAHRGGALHPDLVGVENTLRAFRHAHGLGYRFLETDVHLTADGVLVAFHDAVLDRVTDGTGPVLSRTWAELREVRVGGREPIPTMRELLDALPDATWNIDLKAEGTPAALARLLDETGAWDRVIVASFSAAGLREFRRLAGGRARTEGSPREIACFRFLPAWLAGLLRDPALSALSIPRRTTILGLRVEIATPALIRRAHRAGVEVYVWTVDEAAEMRLLLDRGVDGLMTDRTDVLKDVLRERGLSLDLG